MADRRPRFLGVGATIAAIAVVIALGYMERRSRAEMLESAGWVTHTLRVERELTTVRSLLDEAETGMRGFLLTLDPLYLKPNEQATADLPAAIARLRELTKDNASQRQRTEQLAALTEQRIARLDETIADVKAGRREAGLQRVITGNGRRLMDDIRGVIQSAMGEEEQLLRQREERLDRTIARRGVETQILIAGMAVGLIVGGVLMTRLARAQAMAMREMSGVER